MSGEGQERAKPPLASSVLDLAARILGWGDRRSARTGGIAYLFMSLAFAVMAGLMAWYDAAAMGPLRLSLFSILFVAHIVLHWFTLRFTAPPHRSRPGQIGYYGIQGALIFAMSLLTVKQGMIVGLYVGFAMIFGLYVAMITETAAMQWPEWRATTLAVVFYIGLLALNTALVWGMQTLGRTLPLAALLVGGISLFALLLKNEAWSRLEAESLVRQLEEAQTRLREYADQVEELTISQERQRMAREMHDTLAQGLAGVILQLEAADSYHESERHAEARAVIQQAMQRARQTLHEARRAIQALRSAALEEKDLATALAGQVSQFEATSGVSSAFEVEGESGPLSPDVAQELLRIVQESLSNVARHAQARHVQVHLVLGGSWLQLTVRDDGKGFDSEAAVQRPNSFGLQGMHERARRIGATLQVESAPQRGTTLVVTLRGSREGESDSGQKPPSGPVKNTRPRQG